MLPPPKELAAELEDVGHIVTMTVIMCECHSQNCSCVARGWKCGNCLCTASWKHQHFAVVLVLRADHCGNVAVQRIGYQRIEDVILVNVGARRLYLVLFVLRQKVLKQGRASLA
jgi:hypothetical protein